ncbi:uncharacterized protein SCHCODRAFT_02718713 [Schizophyllum commune H4-8]|nr:uncharacterized protein SCHCODRAFT_02718713 [Schizophyllum commune H4-8]KAI5885708.1 hypothetical protein SCHCODRAFT_02718713 [Schizophyllum commune H4-8]
MICRTISPTLRPTSSLLPNTPIPSYTLFPSFLAAVGLQGILLPIHPSSVLAYSALPSSHTLRRPTPPRSPPRTSAEVFSSSRPPEHIPRVRAHHSRPRSPLTTTPTTHDHAHRSRPRASFPMAPSPRGARERGQDSAHHSRQTLYPHSHPTLGGGRRDGPVEEGGRGPKKPEKRYRKKGGVEMQGRSGSNGKREEMNGAGTSTSPASDEGNSGFACLHPTPILRLTKCARAPACPITPIVSFEVTRVPATSRTVRAFPAPSAFTTSPLTGPCLPQRAARPTSPPTAERVPAIAPFPLHILCLRSTRPRCRAALRPFPLAAVLADRGTHRPTAPPLPPTPKLEPDNLLEDRIPHIPSTSCKIKLGFRRLPGRSDYAYPARGGGAEPEKEEKEIQLGRERREGRAGREVKEAKRVRGEGRAGENGEEEDETEEDGKGEGRDEGGVGGKRDYGREG